jgi:predicted small lipoprotein YifL
MSALRLPVALLVSALAVALAGCGRRAPNTTPDGAVRELVERMRRVQGDPAEAKAAYELLSKRAQQNLVERAKRYSAASGKAIAPEAMIVPSRFLLRFEPQRYTAQIGAVAARVDVVGLKPGDRATVPCIFEEGGWRVDLSLPPLSPLQMRPGSAQP